MRLFLWFVVGIVVLVALRWLYTSIRFRNLPDPVPDAATAAAPVSVELRSLNELLTPLRAKYKLPALAAAVVEDGRLAALGAVGVRRAGHAEPVAADDRFHIGSCTKSMTATLCALLVEQGKLRWDSTIAETLPDAKARMALAWHGVTLEQLLSHRAGLPDDGAPDADTWPRIVALKGPLVEQRKAFVEIVLAKEPATAPGTRFAYSNSGYVIAGTMCERVTGQAWEDLLREHLFGPLGMTTAGFGPPGRADTADQPWGHELSGLTWKALPPGAEADNPAVIGPAGTVHCSLGDWARYAAFHLRGARGEEGRPRPETFKKLRTDVHGDEYAFGWLVVERAWAKGKTLAHDGSNTFWYATIWLAPQRNVAYLAATNLGTDKATSACHKVVDELIAGSRAP